MFTPIDVVLAAKAGHAWPSPQDHPTPLPLEARTSAVKLLASGAFALVLAAAMATALYDNAQTDQAYAGWRLWLRVLAAVGIAGLGVTLLVAGVNAVIAPSVPVLLGANGLSVPGLYSRTVPWSEVRLVVHDRPRVRLFGSGRIIIGIRDGARFGRTGSQDLKPATAPGGLDAAQLPQMLSVPPEGLFARMQAYRAHFGRGGAETAS